MTTADAGPAVAQLVSEAGGIISVGGNTAPAIVRDGGERGFAFVFGDNEQASAGAQYACDTGYKSAYMLGSPEIPYTKDMTGYFEDAFAQICGGEVTGEDTFKIGQTEFGPRSRRSRTPTQPRRDLHADVRPRLRRVPEAAPVGRRRDARSSRRTGTTASLFVDSGGSAVDGTVYTTHGFNAPGDPIDAVRHGRTPSGRATAESNTFEAIGRDNIYALVEAAKAAGSTEADAMLEAVLGAQATCRS